MSVSVTLRQQPRWRRRLFRLGQETRSSLKHFQVSQNFLATAVRRLTITLVGPGTLTRALLQLPKERIRKIIVLENTECFLDSLRVCQYIYILPFARYVKAYSAAPND